MSDTAASSASPASSFPLTVFIGGGNMASAIVGGLLRHGVQAARMDIIEPGAQQALRLRQQFGVRVWADAPSCWFGPSSRKCLRKRRSRWRRTRARHCIFA